MFSFTGITCASVSSTSGAARRRLTFFSLKDEKVVWSLPLRYDSIVRSVIPNGRSLLVPHGSMLSCVSPLERRVLWEHPLPGNSIRAYTTFRQLLTSDEVTRPARVRGEQRPVAIANEDYVCIRNRKTLKVIDAVTGQLRWSRDDVNTSAKVLGTTEAVFVEASDGQPQRTFRSVDGQQIDATFDAFDAVVGCVGPALCIAERKGLVFKRQSIRLFDPIRKTDHWNHKLSSDDRIALTGEREVVVASGSTLSIINMVSGQRQTVENAIDANAKHISVATTADEVFVSGHDEVPAGQVDQHELGGIFAVFDRRSGEKKWERTVNQGSLSLTFFRSQPVLVIAEKARKINDQLLFDLLLLDRNSGEQLNSATTFGRYDASITTSFEPARNFVEVGATSTRRFRFNAGTCRRCGCT